MSGAKCLTGPLSRQWEWFRGVRGAALRKTSHVSTAHHRLPPAAGGPIRDLSRLRVVFSQLASPSTWNVQEQQERKASNIVLYYSAHAADGELWHQTASASGFLFTFYMHLTAPVLDCASRLRRMALATCQPMRGAALISSRSQRTQRPGCRRHELTRTIRAADSHGPRRGVILPVTPQQQSWVSLLAANTTMVCVCPTFSDECPTGDK